MDSLNKGLLTSECGSRRFVFSPSEIVDLGKLRSPKNNLSASCCTQMSQPSELQLLFIWRFEYCIRSHSWLDGSDCRVLAMYLKKECFGFTKIATVVLAIGLLSNAGCAGLAANIMHAIYGHDQPPEFEGLKKQRIAILCENEKGILKDETTTSIELAMRKVIGSKLKKVTLVEPSEMNRWLEDPNASENMAKHVGKGVNADIVIYASVKNVKLYEGKTMYRGSSDVNVDVYDIAQDKYVFTKSLPAYTFPQTAAISTTEMDEARFKRMYIMMVSERMSRIFVPSEMGADLATDAKILEFQ